MLSINAQSAPIFGWALWANKGVQGVQEFRSSGVQEFRSSGVQEFRSSGVQEFRVGESERMQGKKPLAENTEMQLGRPFASARSNSGLLNSSNS
jgi:hypothetical protein